MQDTTFIIRNTSRHHAIYRDAIANDSAASLSERLIILATGAAGYVELTPHLGRAEYLVRWYDKANGERPYMVGGLIYHHSDNTWSIHT